MLQSYTQATPKEIARALARTKLWVERFVIGLNLCPFARPVADADKIRYVVSDASEPVELLEDLIIEFDRFRNVSPHEDDTSLVIHPYVLTDFFDYNDFLDIIDVALDEQDLYGVIQVASFHPQYRFAGTLPDAVENMTNRSPYPMLHLLREASVTKATQGYPDLEQLATRNIERMQQLGRDALKTLWDECIEDAELEIATHKEG